jgi:small nuclear ribonucleoprotein
VSQTTTKRPLTTLQKSTKKNIVVRLKNEVEYKGRMENVDSYMNLIMTDAEELSNGKPIGKFGRVIVRGNNVLFIKLQDDF